MQDITALLELIMFDSRNYQEKKANNPNKKQRDFQFVFIPPIFLEIKIRVVAVPLNSCILTVILR